MTEKGQEKMVDANTGLNDFIVLTEKALYLSLTNWKTVEETRVVDNKEKVFIKFKADVWKYGDSKELLNICADKPKQFSTTHTDFRKKVNAILADKKPSDSVLIRAKVINASSKPVIYDVEVA